MKQEIIDILQIALGPISITDLVSKLNINNHDDQQKMFSALEELKNSKVILENSQNELFIEKLKDKIFIGTIQITLKGLGFIKTSDSEKEYRVNPSNTNNALNGDEITFTVLSKANDEAVVLKILKRHTNSLVGTVIIDESKNTKTLSVQNPKMQRYFVEITNPEMVSENNIVVAKVVSFKNNIFTVKIDKILGNLNDPGVDILAIMHEMGIKPQFEPETLIAANNISQTVKNEDKINRIDLRNEILVTIDGIDAKDFDDAICVKKMANGNYRLLVAIADVSYYVHNRDPLDSEAFNRGTSVYLADRVVPMLPTQLSNGICSLNEQVERLCMVSDMIINREGKTISKKIYQAVMKSVRRMNYDEVNEAYEGLKPQFVDTHPQVWSMLKTAKELYEILWNYKLKKGVIDFEIDEAKIIINELGEVSDIVLRPRNVAEKLIESFMIRANEVVAKAIADLKLPFIYRVHERPKQKKMQQMTTILKLMGLQIPQHSEKLTSKDLQILLDSIKELPNFQVLSTLLLRTMEKARYSNKNVGHFGLASEYYTHFTSPIRRYPDLIVHRLLRQYLITKEPVKNMFEKNLNITALAAEHSSQMEIKAMECERAVEQMKKAEFMSKFVGQKFPGVISGVTSFGLFIELYNTVEGLVKLTDMQDDYYIYHEKSMSLVGERKHKQYKLGQTVNIIVKNANKTARIIDFALDIESENNLQKKQQHNHQKHFRYYDAKKKHRAATQNLAIVVPSAPKKGKKTHAKKWRPKKTHH